MARTYEGDVKRGDMPLVNPEDLIIVPADNSRDWSRYTLEGLLANPLPEIEEMLAKLARNGQEVPISAHPVPGNRLKVHAGFTRAIAALLGTRRGTLPGFRLKVHVRDYNAKEAFLASVIENHDRNETNQVDDAYAVRKLSELGYSDDEIRQAYGSQTDPMSRSWLLTLRKILRLPDEQKDAIRTHQITARAAVLLSETSPELQGIIAEEAQQDAKEEGRPVSESHVLKSARKHKALKTTRCRTSKECRAFWQERAAVGNPPRMMRLATVYLQFEQGITEDDGLWKELQSLFGTR
jgi:hypothetical protein